MDDDDDDLWGPPLVVQDDDFSKQMLRGCEFWFDCRTDVLEENFQNERYCEQVWRILNEKKQDAEFVELEKDSVSLQNDMASSGRGESHGLGSCDSDKTLSAVLPDADTSSAKWVLDEDENTSSISDAQTLNTRGSSYEFEDLDPETRLKPQETAVNDPLTCEVSKDVDTSSCPVLTSKVEEAEEHSCSSLVTDQVFDPIKQAPESKSSSAISQDNIGGSTLRPLVLETRDKVREKASAINEDGETLKDHQQRDSLQDIVTASEPFTTEALLEMCDELDKVSETSPCDERSKPSHPEAVKTVVKDELIINLLTEARQKVENKSLLNLGSVLMRKRQSISNKGMNTSFIRNTKKKVGDEAGEITTDQVKNLTHSTPEIIKGSSVPTQQIMSDSVISISDLKNKTRTELRSIAKGHKIVHYYKLKKEDLIQQLTMKLTNCTEQRTDS